MTLYFFTLLRYLSSSGIGLSFHAPPLIFKLSVKQMQSMPLVTTFGYLRESQPPVTHVYTTIEFTNIMYLTSYSRKQCKLYMMKRKGILLAGGSGSRLLPLTKYVCKQLLPIYNKPLIYYPLYTLAKAGIKDILVISTPETTPILESKLGSGKDFGLSIDYKVQETPNGIAQAFVIGEDFIGSSSVCLILGDNIFYGNQLEKVVKEACKSTDNTIFGYPVSDPERYGVVEFDEDGNVLSIEEKPKKPKSNYAVPGIYFYNNDVVEIAKNLKLSARGEYEITDVNKVYLDRKQLKMKRIGVGNAWLDSGTFTSLNDASNFVRMIEERTGVKISDIESLKKEGNL